jgi:transcriptional regulator with XRE-family HTH domain
MASSVPGPLAVTWFERLRQEHGVSLAATAGYCGLKKQHVTDLRAGRRRFTRKMAENLLATARHEPWGAWLTPLVESCFSSASASGEENDGDSGKEPPASPADQPTSPPASWTTLPLLKAPVMGDPRQWSPFPVDCVEIPRTAALLAKDVPHAYVLELPCDDHARRLRAGDQVLILPLPDTDAEIHVIERDDLLRLARRAKVAKALGIPLGEVADEEWVALDSGEPLCGARSVAHAAGIVWARL